MLYFDNGLVVWRRVINEGVCFGIPLLKRKFVCGVAARKRKEIAGNGSFDLQADGPHFTHFKGGSSTLRAFLVAVNSLFPF